MSGFSLAALKNTLDEVRVSVYAKNETEKKVYDALSSKNWGASSTQMMEIAQETNEYDKYQIINEIIWAALETEGKSWKQIFKALTLVEFLIKNGSERFIETSRDKLFKIKRLQDYNYYEGTVDKGSGCREKAKQIVELLSSNETIRSEREKARALRSKFGGVGSDSRGFGGGGGGSYGGSYSGGTDRYGDTGRYGDSGLDSNRGGGGGRYGGDSYSSDRSYNDRGGSGGGRDNDRYGGDRYSGGGGGGGERNTGRYGGGAYDSDRPPRFNDDGPVDSHSHDRRGSHTRDEEVDIKPPSKSRDADRGSTATGGKLKVSIKKAANGSSAAPAPAPAPAPAAPEVNLMGDDFGDFSASSAPAAQSAAAAFDPFGSAPAQPAAAAFDPFGAAPAAAAPSLLDAFTTPVSAPAPTQQAAFDPFGQSAQGFPPSQPAPQQQFQQQQFQQQQFQQPPPQQQQQFGQFQQQAPPPQQQQQQQYGQQFQGFPSAAAPPVPAAPAPATPQAQPQYRTAPPAAGDADFGDFETAQPVKPAAANKWGDLGSLVDLGGITKNAAAEAKKNEGTAASSGAYASSFAGLDGFNKTPQSMTAGGAGMGAARPMGGYGAPAGPPMMAPPRPAGPPMMMGGGAPMGAPHMGAPHMGAPHMGASHMGAPHMGGPPMGGQMGYGAPATGMGYGAPPAAPMGYGAPQMGGGYGAPQMGGGMMAPPAGQMGGYPPQQQYRPAGAGGW